MPSRSSSPRFSGSVRLPGTPASAHLAVPAPPARLVALLREHSRLLKKIGQKRRELAKLSARIEEMSQRLVVTQPVIDECVGLDREIHALFAQLLSRKRQSRETRRLLLAVYGMLQDAGVLSPSDELEEGLMDEDEAESPDRGAGWGGSAPGGEGTPRSGAGGFSARRPGDEPANQSLRGVFRDLASALHPDKVSDEVEKARRTELMKEISRAYQDRDLARLLDLKRIWMTGVASPPTSADGGDDETGRRCANLERMNTALRVQLRDLSGQLKELRRSPRGEMVKDVRRSTARDRDGASDPIDELIAGAQAELDRTRELRDFVLAFRDGKMTVHDFLRGPPSMRRRDPFDADLDSGADAFSDGLFDSSSASVFGGKRRRASKRSTTPRDARF